MGVLEFIDKKLIPDNVKDTLFSLRKARTLVTLHLFLLALAIIFQLANSFVFHDMNTPPLTIGIFVAIGLIIVFKRYGNFVLSGNLLAFFLFIVFFSSTFDTGGLYSDNLLWLIVVPLLSMLFSNVRSGFLWLLAIVGVACFLYYEDLKVPGTFREKTDQFDSLYFLTTYVGLFIIVAGIVLIFATGQAMIIKALFEKQRELSEQKTELARQTIILKEAEEKILASNKELEQFAYAASHDLKEPLRMVGSYTQLIKRRLGPQMEGATVEYMGFVTDGVSRMERMLNDLLEYSKLGRGGPDRFKDVDMNESLMIVINNLMPMMVDTDAAIYANQLPVVKASSIEMVQVFQNLIANSIKFRKKDESPVIQIDYQAKDGQHHFTLCDNGIGIPDISRQNVFNIFERLHSHQAYEGSGIGLATCKKIITNMGGNIYVAPPTCNGTTFVLHFPEASIN